MKSKVQSPKFNVFCPAGEGQLGLFPATAMIGRDFPRVAGKAVRNWSSTRGLAPLVSVFLAAALGSFPNVFAAETKTGPTSKVASAKSPAAKPETPEPKPQPQPLPQSIFIVPKARGEGVDPFFPLSTRLNVVDTSSSTNKPSAAGELLIKGFSGTVAAPLVIINDRTFGVGDEKEVTTALGRARVHCLEIRLKDEAVLVEANNERRELHFRKSK